ncbi:restriction endonuclease subunit S [Brachybacterium halotolerans subsp. kimchii]|uniref:restriction endonuclease subunit S n=1 Tax=Brachybacterium halotolerans TaxID=2795215 RepID=UPI001E4875DC|nr:restriction endonuclease subunit S [Brachybacterium halotolerans]UEJ82927.1 restriction endonuclease subunit S [Brachybacterium halotolerans subsp. kimchii]
MRRIRLGDLCSKIGSGATPRGGKSVYVENGPDFVRSQNVLDLSIETDGMAHLDEESARQLDGVSVASGDVLLNITGESVGRVSVWRRNVEARVSQHVAILRPDTKVTVPEYLQYALYDPAVKSRLHVLSSAGASRRALTKSMLEQFEIAIPGASEQQAIVDVLGALGDKIAVNREVVDASDSLRRELWCATAEGAPSVALSSLAQFVNGGAYTKDASGTGRVVIRIAELNSGIGASTIYNELDVPETQIARPGDLLMAWSGSLTAARWYRDDAIVNQHIFKVIPKAGNSLWSVACALETKLEAFRAIAQGKATTMGHIKRGDLDAPVAWPQFDPTADKLGSALWERALSAEQENLRLAATRDELLPLLMSGKITVKDAEKTVEEVV